MSGRINLKWRVRWPLTVPFLWVFDKSSEEDFIMCQSRDVLFVPQQVEIGSEI